MPPGVPTLWTEDDRDRRVRVAWRVALEVETPAAPRPPDGPAATQPRPTIAAGVWAAFRRLVKTGPGMVVAAGVVGVLLVAVMGVFGGLSVLAWLFVSPVSGAIIVLAVGVAAAVRREFLERGDQVKELSLGRGVCPVCAYPVGALTPGDDGCVTCPECSSAWRLPAGGRGRVVVLEREATDG